MKCIAVTSLGMGIAFSAATKINAQQDQPGGEKIALPDPVAIVNGEKIPRAELERNFEAVIASGGAAGATLDRQRKLIGYHRILNDMITNRLLDKAAEDVKVDPAAAEQTFQQLRNQFPDEETMKKQLAQAGETVEGLRESIRRQLKKQKWMQQQSADVQPPSEEEIREFYKENPDLFKMPEMVRASHILLAVPPDATPEQVAKQHNKAVELRASIKDGEDFAKLAKEHSDDPGSRERGGDLNYFQRERMVKEFADAAFSLEPGEISEPVRTKFGYHIIKVTDKKEPRTVPLEEAKERIVQHLKDQKRREKVNQTIAQLHKQADIRVLLPEPEAPKSAE